MARFEATVTSPETREAVFDYLADFRSVTEWDPSIRSARLTRGEAGVPGAEFELIVRFLGRDVSMTYRAEVVDRPRRLLMIAETPTVVSRDEITFAEAPGDGTAVTYAADLRLRGPLRVLDPVLDLFFTRISERARIGLEARLIGPLHPRRDREVVAR
jgi:uncharacterized protein YndB with AHSA1/START domain